MADRDNKREGARRGTPGAQQDLECSIMAPFGSIFDHGPSFMMYQLSKWWLCVEI